jgi:hypothetical protein
MHDHMLHELDIADCERRAAEGNGLGGANDARGRAGRTGIEDWWSLADSGRSYQDGTHQTETKAHP